MLPCSETAGDLGLSPAPSLFPVSEISLLVFTEMWTCRGRKKKKGISLNAVEVTKALAKENTLKKQKRGSEWSSTLNG